MSRHRCLARIFGRTLSACAVLLLASGCAAMSAAECRVADWHTIGFEDGARGTQAANIARYRKACAAHGVAPDLAAYRDGRRAGLATYCRAENGFAIGERGGSYAGLCPESSEPEFLNGYRAGRRLHAARAAVHAAERRVSETNTRIATLAQRRTETQAELVSEGLRSSVRMELLARTFELANEQGEAESELTTREVELLRARDALARVEADPYTESAEDQR